MSELSYKSGLLTRYLLGELPPAEQDALEESFFIDDDLFIELLDTKDQLISDYLSQRLVATERASFERRFLSQPDCRHEVELAYFLQTPAARRPLTERTAQNDPPPSQWRKMLDAWRANWALAGATATALIAVAIIGGWLITRTPATESSANIAARATITPLRSTTFTLELTPGQARSQDGVTRTVPATEIRSIKLNLATRAADFSVYQAKLLRLDESAAEILTGDALNWEQTAGGGRIVKWEIPATSLRRGDYQIKLYGVSASNDTESIGAYYFKVRDE